MIPLCVALFERLRSGTMMVSGETGDGRLKTGVGIDNLIVGADLRVRPRQPRRVAPTGDRQIKLTANDAS
ncbi:MAG TPA: hypothetical protein PLA02_01585, partial [Brevefilum fermentans]|nr:hypothetical protein [Brevefilum fermentans]